MTDAAFVDATRPFVRSGDGTTVLFPGTRPGLWFHAALSARTSRTADRFVVSLLRTRRSGPSPGGPPVTVGGVLTTQADLIAVAATPGEVADWSAELVRAGVHPPGDPIEAAPLLLRQGRMAAAAPPGTALDPDALREVVIGSSASAGLTLALSPDGADACRAALVAGAGPPVGIGFAFRFDLRIPACRYRVEADTTAALGVFRRNRAAVAGWYGPAGGQAEQVALLADLRSSGAATVVWEAAPDGFGSDALAVMESAVLQRWVGTATERLGVRVVPGAAAPDVTIPDPTDGVTDLTTTHDGAPFVTDTFRRDADLPRLALPPAAGYAADVALDEENLPLVLNFGRDERVERYVCHLAYRTAGGLTASAHEAAGADGLTVIDRLRWSHDEARPDHVDASYTISWTDPRWEGLERAAVLPTDRACVTLDVSPGGEVAEVTMVSDLATAEAGAFASISWVAQLPAVDGRPPRTYRGGLVVEGAGEQGEPVREPVSFPCPDGTTATTSFAWSVELVLPSGEVRVGADAFLLGDRTETTIAAAALRPPA